MAISQGAPEAPVSRQEEGGLPAPVSTPKCRDERILAVCEAAIDLAAALFNVSGRELRRPGRSQLGIARVRQIAMYVCHVTLSLSMKDVGRGFNRDRTTVLHACHVIENLRDDRDFDELVATVERVVTVAFSNLLPNEDNE